MNPRVVAVVPARYGSTRLPGKPLLEIDGRPLILHVLERVRAGSRIDEALVATDDARIERVVRAAGFAAARTSPDHATGSDRIGELLPGLDATIILNVQGDEPEIAPELLDALVARLESDPELGVATAAAPFDDPRAAEDPNRVKVVTDRRDRALYFSRARVPWPRDPAGHAAPPLLHVGVYAYRRQALESFLALPRGALERTEELEQLRLLENGIAIGVERTECAPSGIDTPADLESFRRRVEARERT